MSLFAPSQFAGGSQQAFTVYGGTTDNVLGRSTSSREYICSIDKDYSYGGEVVGDDGTHRLLNRFIITGLSAGVCSFDLIYMNEGSYVRKSFSLNIYSQRNEQLRASGSVGGTYYIGNKVKLDGALTLQSGRIPSFSSLTPSSCTVANGYVDLLAYGTCTVQIFAAKTLEYADYIGTYKIGVNVTLQQTLTLNVPTSLSIGSTPYPLSYSLTTPNGASELKPTFTVDNPSVCTVSEGPLLKQFRINLLAKGICTITASQAGNGAPYTASNNVVVTVTVTD